MVILINMMKKARDCSKPLIVLIFLVFFIVLVSSCAKQQKTQLSVSKAGRSIERPATSGEKPTVTPAQKSKIEASINQINSITSDLNSISSSVNKEDVKNKVIDAAEKASKTIVELKVKVEQTLKLLKISCPSEKETISTVESQLEELENGLSVLTQTIKSGDTPAIKQQISKIAQLGTDMTNNLKKIEAACM